MKKAIEKHLRDNFKSYLIMFIILGLGIASGIISVNNMENNQKAQINIYLNEFITEVKNGINIKYALLLENSIKNNLKFLVILIILGFSIWGEVGTICMMGYRGFVIGYSISSVIASLGIIKGLIFTIPLVLLSEIIFIPSIFFISIYSMQNYKFLISGNYEENKIIIIRYILSILIATIFIFSSSLLKTYLCSNLFLMLAKYL